MNRGVVSSGGKTHARHPRWSRLAVCGIVLHRWREAARDTPVSCSHCAKGVRPVDAKRARLEETVTCRLRCACGVHHDRELPADANLRQVLAALACASCGEPGRLALAPRKIP